MKPRRLAIVRAKSSALRCGCRRAQAAPAQNLPPVAPRYYVVVAGHAGSGKTPFRRPCCRAAASSHAQGSVSAGAQRTVSARGRDSARKRGLVGPAHIVSSGLRGPESSSASSARSFILRHPGRRSSYGNPAVVPRGAPDQGLARSRASAVSMSPIALATTSSSLIVAPWRIAASNPPPPSIRPRSVMTMEPLRLGTKGWRGGERSRCRAVKYGGSFAGADPGEQVDQVPEGDPLLRPAAVAVPVLDGLPVGARCRPPLHLLRGPHRRSRARRSL